MLDIGSSNAWTGMDRTVYHFMLAHNKLYDGLDRFSGFFTSPLFTEDLTERELNAVDSENNKNLQEDSRREYQLWRSTAKPGSALQRFGTGNKQSLWYLVQKEREREREREREKHTHTQRNTHTPHTHTLLP